MESVLDWVHLSFLPGIGVHSCLVLLRYFGSPSAILAANRKQLENVAGIRRNQIDSVLHAGDLRKRAEAEVKHVEEFGGSIITCNDSGYPELLKQLPDPPPLLYCLGDTSLLNTLGVAIVGSRAATSYGRRVAFGLGRDIGLRGLTVVSGLAHGIDTEAHLGALKSQSATIAVLGCGLDICYPIENRKLYGRIAQSGLIISEYSLGTRPEGFRFPARNRIIAGLGLGVVVVEAARRSGSLITAQIGLDLGREIFSVPGQVDSSKSDGCHWLLQQGARLVRNCDDVLSELRVDTEGISTITESVIGDESAEDLNLDSDGKTLLALIETYPQDRDMLLNKAGITVTRGAELLLLFELDGRIEVLPGNRVRRIG